MSGRLAQRVKDASCRLWRSPSAILDPPRRGCEPQLLQALAGARLPRIEYVSCNPATLARDARLLADAGYTVTAVTPFDMFPFTGHVEVLAEFTLDRKESAAHG